MRNIALNLHYNGVDYTSNYEKCDPVRENELAKMCKKVSNGEMSNLHFSGNNQYFFFPKDILSKSIISLVYEETDFLK